MIGPSFPRALQSATDQLRDTVNNTPADTKDLDVKVKVGWVKGLNRLYFLIRSLRQLLGFQEQRSAQ